MERKNDRLPQSQRTTVPTPMPFIAVADQVQPPSVGVYIIVNERAKGKRARRSPVETVTR